MVHVALHGVWDHALAALVVALYILPWILAVVFIRKWMKLDDELFWLKEDAKDRQYHHERQLDDLRRKAHPTPGMHIPIKSPDYTNLQNEKRQK